MVGNTPDRNKPNAVILEASKTTHVWLLWSLSMVLKCCCHGSSVGTWKGLFLPLCVPGLDSGSKRSIRETQRGTSFSALARCGLDKRPHSMLGLMNPFDLWLWDLLSVGWDLMCWKKRAEFDGFFFYVVNRLSKVLGIWAFSWVMEKSSGWHLFIPSSFAVWLVSRISWTSWLTLIMILVRLRKMSTSTVIAGLKSWLKAVLLSPVWIFLVRWR